MEYPDNALMLPAVEEADGSGRGKQSKMEKKSRYVVFHLIVLPAIGLCSLDRSSGLLRGGRDGYHTWTSVQNCGFGTVPHGEPAL